MHRRYLQHAYRADPSRDESNALDRDRERIREMKDRLYFD